MKTKVIQGHTIRYKMQTVEGPLLDNCMATVGGVNLSDSILNLRELLHPATVVTVYKAERTNILLPEE